MLVNLEKQVQIEARAQVGALLFDKDLIKILAEYFDYNNIFSVKNAAELLENTRINK